MKTEVVGFMDVKKNSVDLYLLYIPLNIFQILIWIGKFKQDDANSRCKSWYVLCVQGKAGENSSSDEEERVRATKSTAIVFGSSGAVVHKSDQNATATREVDTELEKDQRLVNIFFIRYKVPMAVPNGTGTYLFLMQSV